MYGEETLIARQNDLEARLLLNRLGLQVVDNIESRACELLLHAELYLSDRLLYEGDRDRMIRSAFTSVLIEQAALPMM